MHIRLERELFDATKITAEALKVTETQAVRPACSAAAVVM
jgi:hypothetical protein